MRLSPLIAVFVLALAGVTGCRSSAPGAACSSSTLSLHLSWLDAAADDEIVHVFFTSTVDDMLTYQTFPVAAGATQQDVMVDVSHFPFGQRLGATITHGNVVLMTAGTDVVRDACTPQSISNWAVDAGLATPHDSPALERIS